MTLRLPGSFLSAFADWLEEAGHGAAPICTRIRKIENNEYVDLRKAGQLLDVAAITAGDSLLGLCVSQQISWRHLGALGHMLRSARTLEELLLAYVHFEKVFYGEGVANLSRTEGGISLSWNIPKELQSEILAQLTLGTFAMVVSALTNGKEAITEICFPFHSAESVRYEEILQCPVEFEHELLCIRFAASALYYELQDISHETASLFPDSSLLIEIDDEVFRKRLFTEVLANLQRGQAGLRTISGALAMSERTLQRRLSAFPDGLRGVVLRIRMHLAKHYLLDEKMSLYSIARLVGYTEQSSFHKAFQKYFGDSPRRLQTAERPGTVL